MLKFATDDATFYEDGNQLEYYVGEGHPIHDRVLKTCTLAEAKKFCEEECRTLYIQLENGDEIELGDD